MTGPLSAILAAFETGVRSVADISRTTGLNRDVVEAGIDHLISTGRLTAKPLASGCTEEVCGGCALFSAGCGGCGPVPSRTRTLSLAHPR